MRRDGSTTVESGSNPTLLGEEILIHKASLSLDTDNSTTTSIDSDFEVSNILIHFSEKTSTTVTVTVDSNEGVNYDTIVYGKTLAENSDLAILYEEGELSLNKGDEIKVSFTLSAGVTAYVVVYYKLR